MLHLRGAAQSFRCLPHKILNAGQTWSHFGLILKIRKTELSNEVCMKKMEFYPFFGVFFYKRRLLFASQAREKNFKLRHGNARPHMPKSAMVSLESKQGCWIDPRSPYSPDLTKADLWFWLFPKLKRDLVGPSGRTKIRSRHLWAKPLERPPRRPSKIAVKWRFQTSFHCLAQYFLLLQMSQ